MIDVDISYDWFSAVWLPVLDFNFVQDFFLFDIKSFDLLFELSFREINSKFESGCDDC